MSEHELTFRLLSTVMLSGRAMLVTYAIECAGERIGVRTIVAPIDPEPGDGIPVRLAA